MGAVLGVLFIMGGLWIGPAILGGLVMITFASDFGGKQHRRSDTSLLDRIRQDDPLQPKIYVQFRDPGGYLGPSLKNQKVYVKSWDQTTWEAVVCWEYDDTCSTLPDFRIHCYDWNTTTIDDDVPKHMQNSTFTPQGEFVMNIQTPLSAEPVRNHLPKVFNIRGARWAAPIAADCRYWNKDFYRYVNTSLPSVILSDSDPVVTTTNGVQQRPKKVTPDVVGKEVGIVHSRRDLVAADKMTLEEYFSFLPRRHASTSLDIFAREGAAVIHDHLRSSTSAGPFLALHRAATALLRSDDIHNKKWKRVVPFFKAPADADHVIEHLLKHFVDQTHDSDKKRMEVFATHAMIDAVSRRWEDGHKPQEMDGRMIMKFWERLDAEAASS